jgi:hypothetical protein
MAMPCVGCTRCGNHKARARFDPDKSSTGKNLMCNDHPDGVRCSSCSSNQCTYSVSYAEGSRISGHMVEDVVTFSSDSGRTQVKAGFGCQTLETGLFNSQVADGIVGFSWGGGYGRTLMDNLVRTTQSPDVFSMCFAETTGAIVLGGSISPELDARVKWVPFTSTSAYNVGVSDFGARRPTPSPLTPGSLVCSQTILFMLRCCSRCWQVFRVWTVGLFADDRRLRHNLHLPAAWRVREGARSLAIGLPVGHVLVALGQGSV